MFVFYFIFDFHRNISATCTVDINYRPLAQATDLQVSVCCEHKTYWTKLMSAFCGVYFHTNGCSYTVGSDK